MSHIIRLSGIVMALMLTATLSTQSATVRVYGTVRDSDGIVVPGAEVTYRAFGDTVSTVSGSNGVYEVLLTLHPDGISEESAPAPFALSQNYPNPFNPETTIPFSLDRMTRVRLDIYSVTGQRVRTLVDDVYGAGTHSVVWDGRDDSGHGVSAGVYLYRLKVGSQAASKKMLLLDGGGAGNMTGSYSTAGKQTGAETIYTYEILASKTMMQNYLSTIDVSFDVAEIERNIVLPDQYQEYILCLENTKNPKVIILPGDTLSVVLAEIHGTLPEDGEVTLVSQAGDSETIVVSGTGYYIREYSVYADDSRRGIITTSSATPEQGDGILQVDAVIDTVFASYITAWDDTLSTLSLSSGRTKQ